MKNQTELTDTKNGVDNNCDPDNKEEAQKQTLFYKIVDAMLSIRGKIRDSQPDFYKEFNL